MASGAAPTGHDGLHKRVLKPVHTDYYSNQARGANPTKMEPRGVYLNRVSQIWLGMVGVLLAAFLLAVVLLHKSYNLAVFCDLTEALLLLSGAAAFVPLAMRSRGRTRLFWSLIILGITLWLTYQLMWTYYEVYLRSDVPAIFVGDVVLFLNIVPLMAALAVRPHAPRDEYSSRLGRLDFALLLMWWFYLYGLLVLPWQYAQPDAVAYNHNLNAAYSAEKLVFLAGLAACWIRTKASWKKLYASLFGMSFCYAASSALANWAIGRNAYYSGSLYDVPLAVAMAWVTWIGLRAKAEEQHSSAREVSTVYGVWVARCSMIAVFSLPVFAAWAISDATVPAKVRMFRLTLTLIAALAMGAMVFGRQHLLDQELIRLLTRSHESFENLKRLQAQIVQSEKLASIGQLVGGAAHELNNPITAMLGYSDLLLSTRLTAEQAPLAAKIGQHVRRTKSLVASLISFARQGPTPKTAVDLNTLVRTAIKLTQPQWQTQAIEIETHLDASLPRVLGDSNQLLQVCLQIIGTCVHMMNDEGGKVLTISTEGQANVSALQACIGRSVPGAQTLRDEPDVALSACRGILQEHRGRLSRENREDGTRLLRVELPAMEIPSVNEQESTVPVMWQSQPYA